MALVGLILRGLRACVEGACGLRTRRVALPCPRRLLWDTCLSTFYDLSIFSAVVSDVLNILYLYQKHFTS